MLGDDSKLTGLRFTDRNTGDAKDLELGGVFVQIGLLPNTCLLYTSRCV